MEIRRPSDDSEESNIGFNESDLDTDDDPTGNFESLPPEKGEPVIEPNDNSLDVPDDSNNEDNMQPSTGRIGGTTNGLEF